ncbi:hypothetical protein GCM10012275_07970 [Longimycelium tulufanense]|uniref:Capsid maturation protease n=1 Tax=Longimycelium tulufanense TaxID=907463 RepID=A0A8J3C6C7_9PSEU|nr:hypothetical protein [Longimycelium tulufanense]GGM39491.1 hypothetical protein GCM10012275_07970 [Longimycelium tulufanense]
MTTADTLSQDYYQDQFALRASAIRDLTALWPLLDPDDLDRSFPGLVAALVRLVDSYRYQAARLADGYYRDLRESEDIPSGWISSQVEELPVGQLFDSLLSTGPIAIKQAIQHGVPLQRAMDNGLVGAAGAVTRHVLNAGRDQITSNVRQDEHARGWFRVASPRACAFCAMLASRGPMYRTRATAGFRAHDYCMCYPRPMWRRSQAWPSISEEYANLWTASEGRGGAHRDAAEENKRLNDFRRELYAHRNE